MLAAYGALPWAVRAGAPIAWAAFIWVLSSSPGSTRPASLWRSFAFNAAHGVLFAILAALTALAVSRRVVARAPLAGFALATLYGVVDELHQEYVPRRHASLLDVVTDACGALLAAALIRGIVTGEKKNFALAGIAATAAALSSLLETVL